MPSGSDPPSGGLRRIIDNALTITLIAAGLLFLAYQSGWIIRPSAELRAGDPESKAYLETDDPSLKTTDIPPRNYKIIDLHEHVLNLEQAKRFIPYMDELGVSRMCLAGASTYTFTLNSRYGFEGFDENNEELLKIKERWPDRFCAFVTLDPSQEGWDLAKIQDYMKRGADGVKLFLGHGESHGKGPFHSMPLTDPRMEPLYAWLEAEQVPIVYHVNLIKYWDEFLAVMEAHPYLRVNVAHMGLHKNTLARLTRLSYLLQRYPNLYTDLSFGYYTFHSEGFESLAKWRTRSNQWLTMHRSKLLFGADMVLEPSKDNLYIEDTLRSYMQLLEMEKFRFFLLPEKTMHGLNLDTDTLRTIYEEAPATFLMLDSAGRLPDRRNGLAGTGLNPPRPPIPPIADMPPPPEK